MTKNLCNKLVSLAAASAVSLLAVGSTAAMAEGIVLSAETTAAAEAGGITDTDFNLSVTNESASAVSDLSVTFDGGGVVFVGDLAAGGSSAGVPVSMSLDTTAMPTEHFPVIVTVSYIQAAAVVEEETAFIVRLGGQ